MSQVIDIGKVVLPRNFNIMIEQQDKLGLNVYYKDHQHLYNELILLTYYIK